MVEINIESLMRLPLFSGIEPREVYEKLCCFGGVGRKFDRGEFIFEEGRVTGRIGVVLEGSVFTERNLIDGRRMIVEHLIRGDIFGDLIGEGHPPAAVALEPTRVLFLSSAALKNGCPQDCRFHREVQKNLIYCLAKRKELMQKRIEMLSEPLTENKLLRYFEFESERQGRREFICPFGRQTLADFLGVNRSSMTRVLGELQAKGIIEFSRNSFKILK